MPESPVKKRFFRAQRPESFAHVSPTEWNDWTWQLRHESSLLTTPYYLGLCDGRKPDPIQSLVENRSHAKLSSKPDICLTSSDLEIKNLLNAADATKPFFINAQKLPALPARISKEFVLALQGPRQVILNTSYLHPRECTADAFEACARLADSGVIVSNQMLLVSNVNTDPETVKELNHRLLMMRVRPYSILNLDLPAEVGIQIIEALRGWTSGLAVPHYVVKEASGRYKVLVPDYIKSERDDTYVFRNYRNDEYVYRES